MKALNLFLKCAVAAAMCLALALAPAPAGAQDAVGTWDVELDYQGTMIPAKLTIEKGDGGALKGKWSSQRGESEITDIKVEGGKLTFKRKIDFQGQEYVLDYAGTIEGDKLTGAYTTPMGEMAASGTRAGAAAADGAAPAAKQEALTGPVNLPGVWDFTVTLPDGTNSSSTFTAKEEGGEISGLLETELGSATIKGIKVEGNNVSFKTEIDMGGVMVPLAFAGTSGGDRVNGLVKVDFEGQAMELPLDGKRKAEGAAAADGGGISGEAKLPGVWDVTAELPDGTTSQTTMTVKEEGGKLSAKLETEIGNAEIPEIKLEGNKFSYKAEIDMGGVMVPMEVEGLTGGDKIEAKAKLTMEGQEMNLPLKGVRQGASAAAAAPAAADDSPLTGEVNLPGIWDFEATLPDGTTSVSTLTFKDEGGKLNGLLETEIGNATFSEVHVDGNKLHMKAEIDMGGVMVPIEILGSTGGNKIKAEAKLSMEGQEMALKSVGTKKP